MSKAFMTKRKVFTAILAVVMAVTIIFGGTFAWQSINQEALNEVSAVHNPGGRLHDDFNDITVATNAKTMTFDKNVYVENFTTLASNGVQIFARIRLDEYMELGVNAGALNDAGDAPAANNEATSIVYGAELADKSTWITHIPGNEDDPFHVYWNWDTTFENDGKVTYMPTFNKNKDSLEADINGTFDAQFKDYVDYTKTTTKDDLAVYDKDDNNVDEIVENNYTVEYAEECGHVTTEQETHTSKESVGSYVITMDEWLNLPADQQVGNFWVWDNDGWAYWANPIDPDTATGLFLDGISRTETIINEDWYYGINVVAQFITKEDMCKEDNSGFYDATAGVVPSSNALRLLHTVGVDVNTTVADETALTNAFDIGGNITVSGDVNGKTQTTPWGDDYAQYTAEYHMSEGGSLTGGTLTMNEGDVFGLVVEAGADSKKTSAIYDMTITGDSESLVYIGQNGNRVTLTNVEVNANGGAGIYAEWAQGGVVINDCTVKQESLADHSDSHFETAIAAANGADVVVNGGTYSSTKYAVRIFTTGGTVTINGGTFTGALQADTGEIIIKGGSFSENPSAFLAEGYTAEQDTVTGMWIVK